MNKEVKQLRKKLPARGYTSDVKGNADNTVTINQIKNFFSGRAVSPDASQRIVKAAIKAIKANEKKNKQLKRLMKAA
jgi:hypothetical protein